MLANFSRTAVKLVCFGLVVIGLATLPAAQRSAAQQHAAKRYITPPGSGMPQSKLVREIERSSSPPSKGFPLALLPISSGAAVRNVPLKLSFTTSVTAGFPLT